MYLGLVDDVSTPLSPAEQAARDMSRVADSTAAIIVTGFISFLLSYSYFYFFIKSKDPRIFIYNILILKPTSQYPYLRK